MSDRIVLTNMRFQGRHGYYDHELLAAQPFEVDVELVIAVDVSASIDLEEYKFQRQGYIEAIRHPEFIRAISHLPRQRIAVSDVEWSSSERQSVIVPFDDTENFWPSMATISAAFAALSGSSGVRISVK